MIVDKDLCVFDLEATGTWIDKDRIIEIAIVKIKPDLSRETYHKRVNPLMPIPDVVTEITGISDDDVKNEKSFKEIADEIVNFIGDSDLGGFNVELFDIPMLVREFSDCGVKFSLDGRDIYDAKKIYHIHHRRDLTSAYKQYCKKDLYDAHSALADTEATIEVLISQTKQHGENYELKSLQQYDYQRSHEFYDDDRKFRWWGGELCITFGKYSGQTVSQILNKDKGYLNWILEKDFSPKIKSMIKNALKGVLPEREEDV